MWADCEIFGDRLVPIVSFVLLRRSLLISARLILSISLKWSTILLDRCENANVWIKLRKRSSKEYGSASRRVNIIAIIPFLRLLDFVSRRRSARDHRRLRSNRIKATIPRSSRLRSRSGVGPRHSQIFHRVGGNEPFKRRG